MLIILPFRCLFGASTEAAKLVTAVITHGVKNTIQSGIEFNPATAQQYLKRFAARHPNFTTLNGTPGQGGQ
jgi:pentose-5-phosphate-3-epimerase